MLTAVTQARAQATQVTVDASTITDPAAFAQFQAAQDQLSGVLGRLLAISENYPDLKSNQNFLALQSQLEGTENRIEIARRDYNAAVQDYNTELVTIPGSLWAATHVQDPTSRRTPFAATRRGADRAGGELPRRHAAPPPRPQPRNPARIRKSFGCGPGRCFVAFFVLLDARAGRRRNFRR